ncbi:MAG: hypothetical protein WCP72_06215, partial [Desulfomonile sp.]
VALIAYAEILAVFVRAKTSPNLAHCAPPGENGIRPGVCLTKGSGLCQPNRDMTGCSLGA